MIASTLLTLAPLVAPAQETPTADGLVEQAWLLLPAYTGDHRSFLEESVRKNTQAGAHLLRAGLALNPAHVRGLWSLGHAEILLAEDRRNRGEIEVARVHYGNAVEALNEAIRLQPDDPWAWYARGTAHTSYGAQTMALLDLERANQAANARIAAGDDSVSWLRFKILEWNNEVLMRAGEHERAREALRAFHAEFSNNEWPLHIALAESHLRERDFAGARATYDTILASFPADHQAYALLGYLEGLLGNREQATARMLEAIENELRPGLYTRLWLWILATDSAAGAAEEDLRGLLENPPSDLSDWDQTLGLFCLGQGEVMEFLQKSRDEEQRRMDAGEALDDLSCEAWFYAGLRHEHDAAQVEDEAEQTRLLRRALHAHATALAARPDKWKWEWAYARLHLARLTRTLDLPAEPRFQIVEGMFRSPRIGGKLIAASWHRPGVEGSTTEPPATALPGDLFLGTIETSNGRARVLEIVDYGTGEPAAASAAEEHEKFRPVPEPREQ